MKMTVKSTASQRVAVILAMAEKFQHTTITAPNGDVFAFKRSFDGSMIVMTLSDGEVASERTKYATDADAKLTRFLDAHGDVLVNVWEGDAAF